MTDAVPNALAIMPLDTDGPRNFPLSVNALSLAANTHEEFTIPLTAAYVRIAATADVYLKANANAAVPGDTTDGSAAELIRYSGGDDAWYQLTGVTTLSVITAAAGGAVVTASFYSK